MPKLKTSKIFPAKLISQKDTAFSVPNKINSEKDTGYSLFENTSHPLWVLDIETLRFLDVNPAAVKKYGYSKKEFAKISIKDILLEKEVPLFKKYIKELSKGKNAEERYEWHHKTKEGKTITVFASRNIISFNEVKALMVSIHDITEKELAERKLKESEEKYRKLMELANDPIILIDYEKDLILEANKKAQELLEIHPSKNRYVKHSEIHPREAYKEHMKIIKEAVKKGSLTYETITKTKSGKTIRTEVSSTVLNLDHKTIVQCIFRDVTKQKQLENLKTEFLSVAAHELKTPITTIKLMLDALRRKGEVNPDSKYIQTLDRKINHLTKLINELLDISRIETNKLNLQFEIFDITKAIKEVVEKMQFIAGGRKLIFAERKKINAYGDEERIERVLVNLITNAISHSKENTKIKISVLSKNKEILVSVKDQGEGISKENLKKIFDRFFQHRTHGEKTGFGLGLYIAREIVEQHNGKIWVKSKPGIGSTFYFMLPRTKS